MNLKHSMDPMCRLGYFVLIQAVSDARYSEIHMRALEPWAALINVPMKAVRETLSKARKGRINIRQLWRAKARS